MTMSQEIGDLHRLSVEQLSAELFVLRERLRFVHREASAGLRRAERDGAIALVATLTNLSMPCDLLPENTAEGLSGTEP